MRFERERRTLICYAGSASEASIDSQPLGSEFAFCIGLLPPARQARPSRTRAGVAQRERRVARGCPVNRCHHSKKRTDAEMPRERSSTGTLPIFAERYGTGACPLRTVRGGGQP